MTGRLEGGCEAPAGVLPVRSECERHQRHVDVGLPGPDEHGLELLGGRAVRADARRILRERRLELAQLALQAASRSPRRA